jgi:hypothetical protein
VIASRSSRFTPGENSPVLIEIEDGLGSKTGLDNIEKRKFLVQPGLEFRPQCRLAMPLVTTLSRLIPFLRWGVISVSRVS